VSLRFCLGFPCSHGLKLNNHRSQGSGAGQAIEDALFITSLLTSPKVANAPISSRPSQIQKAINIYASVRHARGAQVAKTSREAGLLYEFRSVTGEGDDMEKITQNIQHRMQWSELLTIRPGVRDYPGTDGTLRSLELGHRGGVEKGFRVFGLRHTRSSVEIGG
jgi:hypothetical protein